MLLRAKTAVFANRCFYLKCKLLQQRSSISASGNMKLTHSLKKRQQDKVALKVSKGAIKAPHSIVSLIYKSVIRNSVVPHPVCSRADWSTISDLLKPYLCNGSLRGLSNLWLVTFPTPQRAVPPLPIRENVRLLPRPQHNLILTGMFDSFFLLPAFRKRGIIIVACLKWTADYVHFLTYKLPWCQSDIFWMPSYS